MNSFKNINLKNYHFIVEIHLMENYNNNLNNNNHYYTKKKYNKYMDQNQTNMN